MEESIHGSSPKRQRGVWNLETSIGISNMNGKHAEEAPIQVYRAVLDNQRIQWIVSTRHPKEVLDKWVNRFWLKPYKGSMPTNPFKE